MPASQETRPSIGLKPSRVVIQKAAILLLASCISALLFFPYLAFRGYPYAVGEVAPVHIKSPVDAESEGVTVKKGEVIVREGEVVSRDDIPKFRLIEASVREKKALLPVLGFFVLSAALMLSCYYFSVRNVRKFASSPRDLLLMCSVFAGMMVLVRLSEAAAMLMDEIVPGPSSVYRFVVPVAAGPMLVRLLINSETAVVFTSSASVIAGYFMGGVDMAAYTLAGGIVAASGVRHCTHRSIVLKAGILAGCANVVALLGISAVKGGSIEPFQLAFTGLSSGVLSAILAIGIAPVLESAFRYTTDIKLLELSRMEHQLLKELAIKAPGTYHHSLMIGTLAEAAAESINANPLLARVASYYHDIGKLKMPQYFIENANGEDRHTKLTPSMSSLVLSSHVKEGVELAKKHRLGAEIVDIINQHHGTALITFFYQKAKNQQGGVDPEEGDYRYPGPKPQTKEAGIVMLADAIEAASKTLPDPTPDRVQWLTQKIVNRIFSDGQLDECELTLKDLHAITRSFNRVFAGIYHQRIEYPEPVDILKEKELEGAGAGKRAGEGKEDGRDRLKRLGV